MTILRRHRLCALAPSLLLLALEKRYGLPQFGQLVDDVIRLCPVDLFPALVGGKENGLHADPACAVNVAVHVVAHEKDVFRQRIQSIKRSLENPPVGLSVAANARNDDRPKITSNAHRGPLG